MKIIVIEDEAKQARLLADYLEQAGCRVMVVDRGDEAVGRVRAESPDAVLLDLMLPGLDGLSVCREIRSFSDVPILMITAKVEEIDRLLGLELGADDYICKPFSPREVVARVKAVLRRARAAPEESPLAAGPLRLDETRHTATVNDEPLSLTPSEFKLLQAFMGRPGKVFSRGELVCKLQGYEFEGYERTVDSHIKNLRRKLTEKLPQSNLIQTVYGLGYKFEL